MKRLLFVLLFLLGALAAFRIETVDQMKGALLGYAIVTVILFAFYRYPYHGLLMAFALKPVVDFFWLAKKHDLVSPLYIAGIAIPLVALIARRDLSGRLFLSRHDRVVAVYLALFTVLSLLKVLNMPEYAMNSVESLARILSVTAFYFIGKLYFDEPKKIRQLAGVIVLSAAVPFAVTLVQIALGSDLTVFSGEMAARGEYSAFYLKARYGVTRVSGIYEGVYELAFLGLFTFVILLTRKISREVMPAWGWIMGGLGLFFLYSTYSRSAWAMFVLGLLLFSIIRGRRREVGAVLLASALLYLVIPGVQSRWRDEIGFLAGTSPFSRFGYGRGQKWLSVLEEFGRQDVLVQLTGRYGLGNPENQFINVLVWFGFVGLAVLLALFIYLTVNLWRSRHLVANDNSYVANLKLLFIGLLIASYWVAGFGNNFMTMISVQWILWTWTGIILSGNGSAPAGKGGPGG